MLKNYSKIAWRNLTRHKGYTAVNILGLVIATLFIGLPTVSWQTVRTALANPVDSLRSE